jgi:hypothetical protein
MKDFLFAQKQLSTCKVGNNIPKEYLVSAFFMPLYLCFKRFYLWRQVGLTFNKIKAAYRLNMPIK